MDSLSSLPSVDPCCHYDKVRTESKSFQTLSLNLCFFCYFTVLSSAFYKSMVQTKLISCSTSAFYRLIVSQRVASFATQEGRNADMQTVALSSHLQDLGSPQDIQEQDLIKTVNVNCIQPILKKGYWGKPTKIR